MKRYNYFQIGILLLGGMLFQQAGICQGEQKLAREILANKDFDRVYEKGLDILGTGFNAGTSYDEVWIRDMNTFIRHSLTVLTQEVVRKALLGFFYFQGFDGQMIDGYMEIPEDEEIDIYYRSVRYDMPGYAFHKNTVETDQETSLIQAIRKYVEISGDWTILEEEINGMNVLDRMELMLKWLMNFRYNKEYGLIWGAATADWGDVHPDHSFGVKMDEYAVPAIDIYDNAMFLIALDDFISLQPDKELTDKWQKIHSQVSESVRQNLWDKENQKFIPHLYITCPTFKDIDENEIFYHGGTTVAIQAGLLDRDEILASLLKMRENIKASGATSIGLTMYPPYPEGTFLNPGMGFYQYQNGGDWTWFGGRTITALVQNGFVQEAYEEMLPMISRVIKNDGFYEWYTVDGVPKGSGIFRGSAGVLLEAIDALRAWAQNQQ